MLDWHLRVKVLAFSRGLKLILVVLLAVSCLSLCFERHLALSGEVAFVLLGERVLCLRPLSRILLTLHFIYFPVIYYKRWDDNR